MRTETDAVHAGHDPRSFHGYVNPPVYRGSTILFERLADFEEALESGHSYARDGTPTSRAFEQAVAELEGGFRGIAAPSGLSAITAVLLTYARAGGHVLVSDRVYLPVRLFCDEVLARLGVRTTFYDPCIGAGIEAMISPDTTLVYMESPASLTFDVQDVPALTTVTRARGVVSAIDNTWATPLFCKPLQLGADIVIHSATKYIGGHADAMLGVIVTGEDHYADIKRTVKRLGQCPGPEDVYLGLRGVRTLPARLRQHQSQALALAHWLQGRPEVERVLHPALPDFPGHALWQRDFCGSSGLFGIVLKPVARHAVTSMLDGMSLFGIGSSWGAYESLLIETHPERHCSATTWPDSGPVLRLHAGLEHIDDLTADLEAGFIRMRQASTHNSP